MPEPNSGESHDDFIKRCIPIVIEDGTAVDGAQANAICESLWDRSKEEEMKMADPKPTDAESMHDFITRCIPIVIENGTASNEEEAMIICSQIWDPDMMKDSEKEEVSFKGTILKKKK